MNAFIDFDEPIDVFTHLLIGAEGTLGFIVSAELNTLPVFPVYSSSLLYFQDVVHAAAAASPLGESGALSVEMMDYPSLASTTDKPVYAKGTTAMLIDYGAHSSEEMQELVVRPPAQKAERDSKSGTFYPHTGRTTKTLGYT